MQQVEVLVRSTDNVLLPGQTISGMNGETIAVETTIVGTEEQTQDQAAPLVEDNTEEQQEETENSEEEENQEGE